MRRLFWFWDGAGHWGMPRRPEQQQLSRDLRFLSMEATGATNLTRVWRISRTWMSRRRERCRPNGRTRWELAPRQGWKSRMTMATVGENMVRKTSSEQNSLEAITDALFVTPKIAGRQSRCKEQMRTPAYWRSRTKESTPVPTPATRPRRRHHRKSKNRNATRITTAINKSNHRTSFQTFEAVWWLVLSVWRITRWHIPSLFLQPRSSTWRMKTVSFHSLQLTITLSAAVSPNHFCHRRPKKQTASLCPHARRATSTRFTTSTVRNLISLIYSRPTLPPPVLLCWTWISHLIRQNLTQISHLIPQLFSLDSTWALNKYKSSKGVAWWLDQVYLPCSVT